jgi:hypothetical protein
MSKLGWPILAILNQDGPGAEKPGRGGVDIGIDLPKSVTI